MTDAGWARGKVTAECIRDTLREQGNVLSPHVVAQCIDDLLRSSTYHQGRVAGMKYAAIICRERGKPHDIEWWNTASKKEISRQTAIDCAELIEQQAQGGKS